MKEAAMPTGETRFEIERAIFKQKVVSLPHRIFREHDVGHTEFHIAFA